MENINPCVGITSLENTKFFEIKSTPPDERKKAQRAAELAASQEVSFLLLTPFTQTPKMCFDRIKLGSSGVRQLIIRNPGKKPLEVVLDRLPNEDKGFVVDYTRFRLGGQEETTLLVGWTPLKGGGVRDSIGVKFDKFRCQVTLIGSCLAPEDKLPASFRPKKPLGPRNVNTTVSCRGGSKGGPAPAKITIPVNPVERKDISPPKRYIGADLPPAEEFVHQIPDVYETPQSPTRRETFVRERPAPAPNDVTESTPIHAKGETIRDRSSRLSTILPQQMMGPPATIPRDRRLNFMPKGTAAEPEAFEAHSIPSFNPEDLQGKFDCPVRRETFIKPTGIIASWTPQKMTEEATYRNIWDRGEPVPVAANVPEEDEKTYMDDIDNICSFQLASFALSPPRVGAAPEKVIAKADRGEDATMSVGVPSIMVEMAKEEPINLSLKTKEPQINIYQPEVSDISLAESVVDETSINLPDESMAVNVSAFTATRLQELELEDVQLEQENEDQQLDDEIEQLARERAASACRDEFALGDLDADERRLSSVTVVKSAPCLDASALPDVSHMLDALDDQDLDLSPNRAATHVEIRKTILTEQEELYEEAREVVWEEVVCNTMEYEYEVRGNQRLLVGERNIGQTVSVSETENFAFQRSARVKQRTETVIVHSDRQAARLMDPGKGYEEMQSQAQNEEDEEAFARQWEDNLCSVDPEKLPRGVLLSTSEIDGMIGMLSLADPARGDKAEEQLELPGLRGSPRVSNLHCAGSSFLCRTVSETSFLPPNPDDPRRCSTGVKKQEPRHEEDNQTTVHGEEVRKSLFHNIPTEAESAASLEQDFNIIPLSSGGHLLPIVSAPSSPISRLSSETYVAGGDQDALSTIQELDELSLRELSRNGTYDKDNVVPPQSTPPLLPSRPSSSAAGLLKPTSKERTPARPRRSNIRYVSKPIEAVAVAGESHKSVADSDPDSEPCSGLMFIRISPGHQEKRKPSEERSGAPGAASQLKKSRVAEARSAAGAAGRTGAVGRPKTAPSLRTGSSLGRAAASSVAAASRRSLQPVKKLSLAKPVSKAALVVHHPNPFAARNMYYDERWVEKQERGFSHWLNFVLTPQSFEDTTMMAAAAPTGIAGLDVARLWSQCSQDVRVPRAPTREVMSMRAYTARGEMNRLRRNACRLWQSREVASVVNKLEIEIEKLRLVIRKDRNISKDVGMKQALLLLLLSYNPLWLRVGLETVYGELLPLASNTDLVGISRFLITRLLSNPEILADYAHPTVPHCYRPGHQDALHKFILKKFLELVFFLDHAKERRLIRHNPCLFCLDSQHKASREIVLAFSRDYLAGEGDIIKHLAYFGYEVGHKQTVLDEFDYAVANIATDLRCGIRLTKVAELLTGENLCGQLRVPAVSRLQKVHNTEVALKALRKMTGALIPANIGSKDLVDGHREKTLSLLWSLIFGFQLTAIIDVARLREEIAHLRKSLRVRARLGDQLAVQGESWLAELRVRSPPLTADSALEGEAIELLKTWAQLVTAHYNIQIDNWTVSWCDGRGLCALVHHYQPGLLQLSEVEAATTLTAQTERAAALDDSLNFSYGQAKIDPQQFGVLLENEKKNFRFLISKVTELGGVPILITPSDMSNTIPDEKVTVTFIGYLAVRLLDISREIKAARMIQLAWRKFYAARREEQLKVEIEAAKKIQAAVRIFLKRRRIARYTTAALLIQKTYRGYKARQQLRQYLWQREHRRREVAAVRIQALWRGRQERQRAIRRQVAAACIQAWFRKCIQRKQYLILRHHVIVCQRRYRGRQLARKIHSRYLKMRLSSVTLQRAWRAKLVARRAALLVESVTRLQAQLRGWLARRRYQRLQQAAFCFQARWRARQAAAKQRDQFLQVRSSAVVIQSWVRMWLARRRLLQARRSLILLQALARGRAVRREMEQRRRAASRLQAWWRSLLLARQQRASYLATKTRIVQLQASVRMASQRRQFLKIKAAAIKIQAWYRGYIERREFLRRGASATSIQRWWKGCQSTKAERKSYLQLRAASLRLQSHWRMLVVRRIFVQKRASALAVQSAFRRLQAKQRVQQKLAAISTIQAWYRGVLTTKRIRNQYLADRTKIIVLQAAWKMVLQRKKFLQLKTSTVLLQSQVRGLLQRRRYHLLRCAAVSIQQWLRTQRQGQQVRREYLACRCAVVSLQAWWRMVVVRRQFLSLRANTIVLQAWVKMLATRREYLVQRTACVNIQRWLRGSRATAEVRSAFLRKKQAAVAIQKRVRGWIQRRKFLLLRRCAVRLQAHCRGLVARRRQRQVEAAAVVLQQRFRALLSGRAERQKYEIMRVGFTKLAALVRARRVRHELSIRSEMATKVQSLVRMRQARRQYLKQIKASKVIQQRYRAQQIARNARAEFIKKRNAAISIQAWWRGEVCRRRYESFRQVVVFLQSHVRRYQEQRRFHTKKLAILLIQQRFRSYQLMRSERASFVELRISALLIQKAWRGARARKQFQGRRREIIKVQSQVRGFLARRRLQHLLEARTEHASALKIQSAARCFLARRRLAALREERRITEAATCLQSVCRQWLQRRQFLNQKAAAVTLQRHWRALQAARASRQDYLLQKAATLTLQAAWRGRCGRAEASLRRRQIILCQAVCRARLVRQQYLKIVSATVILQQRTRAWLIGRRQRQSFLAEKSTAIALQSWWRMAVQRRRYVAMQASAILIQSWLRMCYERRRFLCRKTAARTIQAWRRNLLIGRQQRAAYVALQDAALKIQRRRRLCLFRRALTAELQRVVVCQAAVRGFLARRRAERLRKAQLREWAALRIQTAWRGAVQRRNYQRMQRAAQLIQTWFKASQETRKLAMEYRQMKESAIHLQCWWRKITARRRYLSLRRAVLLLQSRVRGSIQRHRYHQQRLACLTIQSWWRSRALMRAERHRFLTARRAAIHIQGWWRTQQTKLHYCRVRSATLLLQRWARGLLARRLASHRRVAIAVLQNRLREYLAMKRDRAVFLQCRCAVIHIQTAGRGWLARQHHLRLVQNVEYREEMRRLAAAQEAIRRQEAANVLVRAVRRYLVRRRWVKIVWASTVIQKFWRGYRFRREMLDKFRGLTVRLGEIRERLSIANAAAKPEDRLGARTAQAIDYIFTIRDMAELICAVQTLEVATRFSEDCCQQMACNDGQRPIVQLVSLMNRCNRSFPHMEVVSTTLDVLINIGRVESTRGSLLAVPRLLPDLFQTMLVFKDSCVQIFGKVCALLQLLATLASEVKDALSREPNRKKLLEYKTAISNKQKLKEQNMKRRSYNTSLPPPPLPAVPKKAPRLSINTTVTLSRTETSRKRLGSKEVAMGPPWLPETRPRFHDDPLLAVQALLFSLGIEK